jgi:hypothetical protein
MYPLNMKLVDGSGFAVANDEIEHQKLTEAGYGPAYVPPAKPAKATKGAPADAQPDAGE